MIVILGGSDKTKDEIKIDLDKLSPILQRIVEIAIGEGLLKQGQGPDQVFEIDLGDVFKYISAIIKLI